MVKDFIFDIDVIGDTIDNQPKLIQQDSVRIGGLSGVKGILTGGEGEKNIMASVVKGNRRYNFYGRPANSIDKSYFDQILSTFKFLE